MVRLIVGIAVLVVLAVLLLFNGTYMTPISLFGYRFERVSVAVVAAAGFVLGILYSFLLYLMRFLNRRRRKAIKSRDENGLAEPLGAGRRALRPQREKK